MSQTNKLGEVFKKLTKAFPRLAGNSEPLGSGYFGIVVDNADGTVTKFLSRPDSIHEFENSLKDFYHEVRILEALSPHRSEQLPIPVLVREVEELYHPDFAASYEMTKVEGQSHAFCHGTSKMDHNAVHEAAGRLIGSFHNVTTTGFPAAPIYGGYDGCQVPTSKLLGDKTNEALEKANAYLQANRKSGLIHGDAGLQNFVYRNGVPVSIIDFAFTGVSENMYADMRRVPAVSLPAFIKGYEQSTGEKVDMHTVHVTQMSYYANHLHRLGKFGNVDPDLNTEVLVQLNTHLNRVIDVTGFKP